MPPPARERVFRVLHLEDSELDHELLVAHLARGGLQRRRRARIDSGSAPSSTRSTTPWDAVISDYNLPGFSGLVALELLKASGARRSRSSSSRARSARTPRSRRCATAPATTCRRAHLARLVPALLHAVDAAETRRARVARRPRAGRIEAAPARARAAPADQRRARARGDRARDPRRRRRLAHRAQVRPRLDRAPLERAGGRLRASARRSRR